MYTISVIYVSRTNTRQYLRKVPIENVVYYYQIVYLIDWLCSFIFSVAVVVDLVVVNDEKVVLLNKIVNSVVIDFNYYNQTKLCHKQKMIKTQKENNNFTAERKATRKLHR